MVRAIAIGRFPVIAAATEAMAMGLVPPSSCFEDFFAKTDFKATFGEKVLLAFFGVLVDTESEERFCLCEW